MRDLLKHPLVDMALKALGRNRLQTGLTMLGMTVGVATVLAMMAVGAGAQRSIEQQVRAVCGLPLGSTQQHRPAAMANLLGDLWETGAPAWDAALAHSGVKLHLYGKDEPPPGPKMGHLTALADSPQAAAEHVLAARAALLQTAPPVTVRMDGS